MKTLEQQLQELQRTTKGKSYTFNNIYQKLHKITQTLHQKRTQENQPLPNNTKLEQRISQLLEPCATYEDAFNLYRSPHSPLKPNKLPYLILGGPLAATPPMLAFTFLSPTTDTNHLGATICSAILGGSLIPIAYTLFRDSERKIERIFRTITKKKYGEETITRYNELQRERLSSIENRISFVKALPADPTSRKLLGDAYYNKGMWDAAETTYTKVLELLQQHGKPLNHEIPLESHMKDAMSAIHHIKQALHAHENKDYKTALAHLQRAEALNPGQNLALEKLKQQINHEQ